MNRTILHSVHVASGARMVEFGGWDMPVQYREGILAEHLATRRHAGLFDVSHMGRIEVGGRDAVPFLRAVLSNDAARLCLGDSHYTLLPTAAHSMTPGCAASRPTATCSWSTPRTAPKTGST